MDRLAVGAPCIASDPAGVRLWAPIQLGSERFDLWFTGPAEKLALTDAGPFLVTLIPMAMHLGLPVVCEAPVSPRLLGNVWRIQSILAKWYPTLKPVCIDAMPSPVEGRRDVGTAVLFSGGLDSLYTTYRNLDDIDMLILVHGFDMRLNDIGLRTICSQRLREAAGAIGKPLVEVATNSRDLTDRYVSWPNHQFGAALASVGLAMEHSVRRVYIAASESYAHLEPCGSHPLLDPLWSTENVAFVHDGAEASRNEKVAYLKAQPGSLRNLRVCWENPGSSFNCGRCEKCIRTMIELKAGGALDDAPVFDVPLNVADVAAVKIPMDLVLFHVEENLRVLRSTGDSQDLVKALEASVSRYRSRRLVNEMMSLHGMERMRLVLAIVRNTFQRLKRDRKLR